MFRLQRLGALAGLLGVLSLSGCASEGRPPQPAPATESSTSSATTSLSEEPSDESSEDPSDGPAAEGPAVEGKVVSFRVPEGYRVSEFGVGIYNADRGSSRITLLEVPGVGDITLRQMVSVGFTSFEREPRVRYDAELGGQPAWVAVGTDVSGTPRREYGAVLAGSSAVVSFRFSEGTSRAEQDALVESVLATFAWK